MRILRALTEYNYLTSQGRDFTGLDILAILTPHSGHIDPPNERRGCREEPDKITFFF
jgi:hypothetical protein